MKKFILYSLTSFLAFSFIPNESMATTSPMKTETSTVVSNTILANRLDEIKSMDKSSLSRSEKNSLRKEVRSIDKKMRDGNGGIYISVGALLIIILILIIIL